MVAAHEGHVPLQVTAPVAGTSASFPDAYDRWASEHASGPFTSPNASETTAAPFASMA